MLHIDGTILKMDFLQPPSDDEDLVILLLVVILAGKTHFVHYEWDASKGLRSIPSIGQNHLARSEGLVPLLMIPFSGSTGFMLVCQQNIIVCRHFLADPTSNDVLPIPSTGLPEESGSSNNLPLWTAWARPFRRDRLSSGDEEVFLCREDGFVRLIEFDRVRYRGANQAGKLHINVDTAFAALDNGIGGYDGIVRDSYDALVAAGNMSEGGVSIFKARQNGQLKQPIPNWAPVLDFTTAHVALDPPSGTSLRTAYTRVGPRSKERVFACVGRGQKQGAICEMRLGTEAQVRLEVEVEAGVRAMWILPNINQTGVQILLTYSNGKSILLNHELESLELSAEGGIDTETMTLAATTTVSGIAIQITETSVRARVPRNGAKFQPVMPNSHIISACIDARSSLFLIATRETDGTFISSGHLLVNEQGGGKLDKGEPEQLPSEPTCMFMHNTDGHLFAFVGTPDQKLFLFEVNEDQSFTPKSQHIFDGDMAICESIAVLRDPSNGETSEQLLVFCGLRNGSLSLLRFDPEPSAGGYIVHSDLRDLPMLIRQQEKKY